jgi:hypothetical protein
MDSIIIPLTPAQFEAKKAELHANGVSITGPTGKLSHDGVNLSYSYDGVAALTVVVTSKPFLVPESLVAGKIRDWFSS